MPILPTEDSEDKPPFRESAEVLLAMWKAGDYPNLADAVQDCKALLYAVPPEHASYRPQLEAILEEATVRLATLAAARAAMPDPPPSVRSTGHSARKKKPAPAAKAVKKLASKKTSGRKTGKKTAGKPVPKKVPVKNAAAKKASARKSSAKKSKKAAPKKAKRSK